MSSADAVTPAAVPLRTWLAVYARLFAVQGSWNYETLLGNGIAFAAEPALRELPGGREGAAYHQALGRQAQYFNAHPYLASVAVGALIRAELDGEDPARIERFRTALCGPLGSIGDRLVWAAWLPFCSLVALGAYGLHAPTVAVVLIFLTLYNLVHLPLRAWGLVVGWSRGTRVASALGEPLLRRSPELIGRVGALLAGIVLPLAFHRVIGPGRVLAGEVVAASVLGSLALVGLHARLEGWRAALAALLAFVLFSVLR